MNNSEDTSEYANEDTNEVTYEDIYPERLLSDSKPSRFIRENKDIQQSKIESVKKDLKTSIRQNCENNKTKNNVNI